MPEQTELDDNRKYKFQMKLMSVIETQFDLGIQEI